MFRLTGAFAAMSLLVTGLLPISGCSVTIPGGGSGGKDEAARPSDPFAAAAADSQANERPFVEPARPFLTALAARNYAAVYDQLSGHAKAKMFPAQFTPSITQNNTLGTPIQDVTLEQFQEWMAKAEAELGSPSAVRNVSVFEIDPQVLSGKGEPLSVMFAIGSMPAEIPAEIRKASIRAQLTCLPTRAWAEAIAQQNEVTADQVLAGQVSAEVKEEMEDNAPYMNVKFVLVEEGGRLKVGYFELMPPSLLD
jgi:hypothetical protein